MESEVIMRKVRWRCLRSTWVEVGPGCDELPQVVGAKNGRVSDEDHHHVDVSVSSLYGCHIYYGLPAAVAHHTMAEFPLLLISGIHTF